MGYIFPSAEIGRMRDELAPDALYHVDATQAFGKFSPKPREWHAELASVASHKIGGPRGIGALYVRDGAKMHTNAFGGGHVAQEAPAIAPSGGHPALAGQHDAARELLRRDDA